MYRYKKNEFWGDLGSVDSKEAIVRAEQRVKDRKKELEEAQYLYDLMKREAVKTLKEHVSYDYMYFMGACVNDARTWMKMLKDGKDSEGNKLDKRKKYQEKDRYNMLIDDLQRYLGLEDKDSFEFLEILEFGFERAGYEFVFNYRGGKFYLYLPVLKNVPMKYYEEYGDWYFRLSIHYYTREHCSTCIWNGFDEEEMKGVIDKYVDEMEVKEC